MNHHSECRPIPLWYNFIESFEHLYGEKRTKTVDVNASNIRKSDVLCDPNEDTLHLRDILGCNKPGLPDWDLIVFSNYMTDFRLAGNSQ